MQVLFQLFLKSNRTTKIARGGWRTAKIAQRKSHKENRTKKIAQRKSHKENRTKKIAHGGWRLAAGGGAVAGRPNPRSGGGGAAGRPNPHGADHGGAA